MSATDPPDPSSPPGWGQQQPPTWVVPPPPSAPPPPGTGWGGARAGPTGQYAYPPPVYGYAYTAYGAPQVAHAGFGARLGALIIDILVLIVPMAVAGYFVFIRSSAWHCATSTDTTTGCPSFLGAELVFLVVWLVVGGLYYVVPIARGGQTIGMKAAGTRVVDQHTGGPIGVGRSIGRFVMRTFISGWICYLGYLWMLWDDQSQTWHDKVASSIVIRA